MDYSEFFSKNLPAAVEMPAGLRADTPHIFSVTNAVPQAIDGALYAEAMSSALLREATSLAGYPGLKGHEGLRGVIADELKDKRSADVDIDDIFISDGAGGAIRKLVDAFIDAGDVVLAEEFTYSGTLNMLLSKRAEVIHVNSDMDGMDTEVLEAEIKRLAARGRKPKFIYTIPVYQNPTGATLSLERRKHMLRIAAEYNIPIVENESYADFRIDGDPLPPSMLGMDDSGLGVISLMNCRVSPLLSLTRVVDTGDTGSDAPVSTARNEGPTPHGTELKGDVGDAMDWRMEKEWSVGVVPIRSRGRDHHMGTPGSLGGRAFRSQWSGDANLARIRGSPSCGLSFELRLGPCRRWKLPNHRLTADSPGGLL